jgi:hypothetical protein
MMPAPAAQLPPAMPSVTGTDELLTYLMALPACPERTEVLNLVLDYRLCRWPASVCFRCAGERIVDGGPCGRCGGSGQDPNP